MNKLHCYGALATQGNTGTKYQTGAAQSSSHSQDFVAFEEAVGGDGQENSKVQLCVFSLVAGI